MFSLRGANGANWSLKRSAFRVPEVSGHSLSSHIDPSLTLGYQCCCQSCQYVQRQARAAGCFCSREPWHRRWFFFRYCWCNKWVKHRMEMAKTNTLNGRFKCNWMGMLKSQPFALNCITIISILFYGHFYAIFMSNDFSGEGLWENWLAVVEHNTRD